ncbi:MAG: TetR/AcrR family transcriptional regulator, partial [Nocardia sp.]|nr:TetR/AcrR family transcriptional regulator [Nocardia sp.]
GRLYGGITGEERIAERRRKLVEAGTDLFGSSESGSVRVKDVAVAAGLTERYFYESFNNLDALFDEVLERAVHSLEIDVNAALEDAPQDNLVRMSIALRTAVASLAGDPRKIRIIFVEALGNGRRASFRRHEFSERGAANFFRWTHAGDDYASGSVEARMRVIALAGATSELMISWGEGFLDVTPDELAEFLVGQYWRTNLP